MSYPLDLDEYEEAALMKELRRRDVARANGLCDYCGRGPKTRPCKFPARHGAETTYTDIKRWLGMMPDLRLIGFGVDSKTSSITVQTGFTEQTYTANTLQNAWLKLLKDYGGELT